MPEENEKKVDICVTILKTVKGDNLQINLFYRASLKSCPPPIICKTATAIDVNLMSRHSKVATHYWVRPLIFPPSGKL